MKKIKKYDKVFKETILKLHETGKSLKELSSEYCISTQSIGSWKRNLKKLDTEKGKVFSMEK